MSYVSKKVSSAVAALAFAVSGAALAAADPAVESAEMARRYTDCQNMPMDVFPHINEAFGRNATAGCHGYVTGYDSANDPIIKIDTTYAVNTPSGQSSFAAGYRNATSREQGFVDRERRDLENRQAAWDREHPSPTRPVYVQVPLPPALTFIFVPKHHRAP